MFIQKTDPDRSFQSIIAKRFQKYNFIEFKAPDDALGIDAFFKGRAEAELFKVSAPSEDAFKVEDITCTFVRQRKPARLIERLEMEFGYAVTEEHEGIYYVRKRDGKDFSFQIVVVGELDTRQCGWLGVLKKGITREEFHSFLTSSEALEDAEDIRNAETIGEIVVKANEGLIRAWKEDEEMSNAMREIMKEELEEAAQEGRMEGRAEGREEGRMEGRAEGRMEGRAEGRMEGRAEGREEGRQDTMVASIRNIMESFGVTIEKAMDSLKVPKEQRAAYAGLVMGMKP